MQTNKEEFTIILWNPSHKLWNDILQKIPNIIQKEEFFINKKTLENFIWDIYKHDTRCNHKVVLPIKINALSKYLTKHLVVKIIIENPIYKDKICENIIELKNRIRKEFNSKCNEGPQGLIHICDDNEQSKIVWDICNKFKIKYPKYPDNFNNPDKPIAIMVEQDKNDKTNLRISPFSSSDEKWKLLFKFNALKNQDIHNSRIKYTIYTNESHYFIKHVNDTNSHYYTYKKYMDFYIPSNIDNITNQVYFRGLNKCFEISQSPIQDGFMIPNIDLSLYTQSQHDSYNYFLNILNENDINFIIIRGFKYLPEKPDTDLDTVIHPDSWEKIESIYQKLNSERIFAGHSNTVFYNSDRYMQPDKLSYIPMFMYGYIGNKLSTGFFRFDTYSDLFFYLNGEGDSSYKSLTPTLTFYNYVFNNKKKIDNYYVPNNYSEIILSIFRCLYDKKGDWNNKRRARIDELIHDNEFKREEFEKVSNYVFKKKDDVYNKLINKDYKNIAKPEMKNILFILRKQGIKQNIIEYLKNQLNCNGYEIIDNFLVTLNNKEKFLKEFYGDKFELYKDDILKINDNQCLAYLVHHQEDKDPNDIKLKIRNYAAESSSGVLYNIIHCSDNPEECEIELFNLLDNNVSNFKNIGTHYSQVNPKCYNIFKMGSCRSQLSIQTMNINNNPGYLHTTKEVLQFLDFMEGIKKITDIKYPELVCKNYNSYDYKLQKQLLDNSHVVLIEISSIKILHDDNNNIYQQDYFSSCSQDKRENMNLTYYKLSEEQLIEDIKMIKNRIKKPIIFMGAIDYIIKDLSLGLTMNTDYRLESRNMITRVLKKNTEHHIIYEDIEPNINNICPISKKTNKLDICHLSDNGYKIIAKYFENIVNKIIF